MKKLSLLLIIFALVTHSAHADATLVQIASKLVSSAITTGKFKQEKRLKFLRKPLISNGNFIYSRDRGVIWNTLAPISSLLLINEDHLLVNGDEQALPPQFGRIFQALLGGDLEYLAKDFTISADTKKTNWQMQLKPKDEMLQKIIRGIQLSGESQVRSLTVEETSGNVTLISFSDVAHPKQLDHKQLADFAHFPP